MPSNSDYIHPDMTVCHVGAAGLGVIANASLPRAVVFSPGDLLVDCRPIALQIDNDGKPEQLCSGCGKSNQSLMRCGGCMSLYFCSRECQRESWKSTHRVECELLRDNQQLSDILQQNDSRFSIEASRTVRMTACIISKICSENGFSYLDFSSSLFNVSGNPEPQTCLRDVYGSVKPSTLSIISMLAPSPSSDVGNDPILWELYSLRKHEDLYMRILSFIAPSVATLVSSVLSSLPDSKESIVDLTKIINLIKQVSRNSFNILDDRMESIGSGLYPFANFFNHSCYPNAIVVFHGQRIQARAIKIIHPGDEITIGYRRPGEPLKKRKEQLNETYGFSCECLLCSSVSPFHNAYNLSLEEPLCSKCVMDCNSSIKSEFPYGAVVRSLLFSVDWIGNLIESYDIKIPHGCSGSSISSCPGIGAVPSSITSLLTNPPLLANLDQSSSTRQCRRCQWRNTNGYFDRCCAALSGPHLPTNLESIISLVIGPGVTKASFKQIYLTATKLLVDRNFAVMGNPTFPPQLYEFLLCCRTHQLADSFRQLFIQCNEQRKTARNQLLPLLLLTTAVNYRCVNLPGLSLDLYALAVPICSLYGGGPDSNSIVALASSCIHASIKTLSLFGNAFQSTIENAEVM